MKVDIEKHTSTFSVASDSPSFSGENGPEKQSWTARFVDSFRPDSRYQAARDGKIGDNGRSYDGTAAASATAESPLARKLKGRHLQMIAIGGSIGTGLFVGSGSALATGGPASLLIAFGLIGIMLYCTVHALGEMAVAFPVAGSFSAYSTRFIDPAWGFAMGWNYALQWLIVLPLEIVAASITIGFWNQGNINNSIWVTIFLFLIIFINLFGVKGYGEAEFVFSIIKVIAVIGFIILGIILNIGAGPDGEYIGNRYWNDPGAFNNGFKGLCSVAVTAAFAYAGTELVGLAAAETANPRKSLPTAVKQVFWRITIFYIVSLVLIGLLVPYNDKRLLTGSSSADASASPFVIAINDAGIAALPSVMNVVIMIAVLSVGNSAVYGSSRTLAALADLGQAPRVFGYIDRKGRPMVGIAMASAFGFLGYLAGSDKQSKAFNWMLAISGLSSIFTWGSICLAHIRFRRAWSRQGHLLNELAFRAQPGVYGSYLGLAFNAVIIALQFWIGFAPIGYSSLTAVERVESFFSVFLAVPIVTMSYLVYKIKYKTSIVRTQEMDLVTGRRELNIDEITAEENRERGSWSIWKKIYKCFC